MAVCRQTIEVHQYDGTVRTAVAFVSKPSQVLRTPQLPKQRYHRLLANGVSAPRLPVGQGLFVAC